jgi:hypothetical protein
VGDYILDKAGASEPEEIGQASAQEERLVRAFKSVLLDWFGSLAGETPMQPIQAEALARKLVQAAIRERAQP